MTATFRPGEVWLDTDGTPIQAHGGCLLADGDAYYWYGENKGAPNVSREGELLGRVDIIGVSCYSSRDLVHWKHEGVVLPAVPDDESHDLYPTNVLERPKVLKCPKTGKYVLWAHVDSPDYKKASLGVAVSDTPTGPFTYLYSLRPEGRDSRDMTLFQDEGGAAYVFFSSEGFFPGRPEHPYTWNATLRIARLSDDYLRPEGPSVEAFPGDMREGPAVFAHGGRYYMVTSGCTGWSPNPARWHVADHPQGPWQTGGDPCVGDAKGTTFDSQSTFVLPLPGRPDDFVFLADRWAPKNLGDSRYVWLPLTMRGGAPVIEWQGEWSL